MPPDSVEGLVDMFEWSGGSFVTNVGNLVGSLGSDEELGTWSAPVGASSGDLCFLRVGSTAGSRMARLASLSKVVVAGAGFVTCVTRELEVVRRLSGQVVAVARLTSDSVVAGGPRTAWSWLGVPVAPVGGGVPVSRLGPHQRRISTFGGITTLDGDEVDDLLLKCGLAPGDVV